MSIHRERRIRHVPMNDRLNSLKRRPQTWVTERTLLVHRGETGSGQQRVAVTQWNLQLLRQMQHHLPARLRSSGLEKTEMPRRHLALARQIELAGPTPLPPLLQQRPKLQRCV
jgi:hypothetical protein